MKILLGNVNAPLAYECDLTSAATDHPARRTHWEVLSPECESFVSCGICAIPGCVDRYTPDILLFLMDWVCTDEHKRRYEMLPGVLTYARERGVCLVTNTSDLPHTWMTAHSVGIIRFMETLKYFDAILASHDCMLRSLPLVTDVPVHVWNVASEVCLRMSSQTYPTQVRDHICVTDPCLSSRGQLRGGFSNHVIARELIRLHPEYRLWVLFDGGLGEHPQTLQEVDPLIEYLGLDSVTDSLSKDWALWDDYMATLCRSALLVNMDTWQARGQTNYEAAACGVPIVGTAVPQSSEYLGVGVGVRDPLDFRGAIDVGHRLLSDRGLWLRESHRLFHLAKAISFDDCWETLTQIIVQTRAKRGHG